MKPILRYAFAVALVLITALVLVISLDNDFDKVCGYFEKLDKELKVTQLNKVERYNFINDMVKSELSQNSNARQAWEVVIYGEPKVRYKLYKTSVEEITKTDWHCEAMRSLIATTGE